MTPDPLLCERIAKRWCELMGKDPYEVITYIVYPQVADDFVRHFSGPRWEHTAREVPAQLAWVLAIGEGV